MLFFVSRCRGFCDNSSVKKTIGTVKWFDRKKGFGFIVPEPGSAVNSEIFVHQSNIVSATGFRCLTEKMTVSFKYRPDNTGRIQAFEVTAADGSPVKIDVVSK